MSHMLHRRNFKAGKCKTSLKLAVARMKLLKNKREVLINQMKRDLAHLLETGQEKTAMIRVEHVVREEKTMAAYDFIDIYCELIVARLPIIESQKNCPIDLKEAVSSIVFATPRCADIPELVDIRKHFTAKYGKDFVTSALELRPNCGVNRTVVENLSARAPDGQTKLKILTEIAQAHNVEWDPKAFGEKELKPPEDLLNGSRVTETSSGWSAEPPVTQLPPYGQKAESSYVGTVTESSGSPKTSDPANIKTANMTVHSSTEPRASGGAAEGKDFDHPSSQNVNHYTPNRQNWNMDFKDATSAAQAAAESAERASLAARAAAELSSFGKVTRQSSTESHDPLMQDQQRYRNERESAQGVSESMLDSQDITRRRSSHSASLGSGMVNTEDDHKKTEMYCQKCSSEVDAVNNSWQTKKPEENNIESSNIRVESVDHHQHPMPSRHTHSIKEGIRRQLSKSSSSSFSDDNGDVMPDSHLQNYGNDSVDHFFGSSAEGNMPSETKQPSFDEYPSVVFDESVSDDETTGHKYGLFTPSQGTNSPSRFSENLNPWSPGRHRGGALEETSAAPSHLTTESYSPPKLSESIKKTLSPSQSGDLLPAAFDDSDGLNSASEEEVDNAKLGGRMESSNQLHQQNSYTISSESTPKAAPSFPEKKAKVVYSKPLLYAYSDDSDSDGGYPMRIQQPELNVTSESRRKMHGLGDSLNVQPSAGHTRTSNSLQDVKAMSSSPVTEEKQQPLRSSRSSLATDLKTGGDFLAPGSPDKVKDSEIFGSGKELDLGGLKGGFRNKGYTRPPYRTGLPVNKSPHFKQQQTEDTKEQPNVPSVNKSSHFKQQQTEDTKEQPNVPSVGRTKTNSETLHQAVSNQRMHAHVHKEMSSRSPKTAFDSDSDDAEVFPRQTAGSRGKSGVRLSRRTRESPAPSDVSGLSTSTSVSRVTVVSDRDEFSPQDFHATETASSSQIQAKSSGSRRSFGNKISEQNPDPPFQSRRGEKSKLAEANISVERPPSKYAPPTRHPLPDESLGLSQSSEVKQSSNPPPESGTADTSKRLSLNKESASRENSLKKAGHVHPKLPDYDSFAAHFASLRSSQ